MFLYVLSMRLEFFLTVLLLHIIGTPTHVTYDICRLLCLAN